MRVAVEGIFGITVHRVDGSEEKYEFYNSITRRGAIELMGRLLFVTPLAESDGHQIGDDFNVTSTTLNVILESGFVALNRDDRVQYFDLFNVPVVALGDNRAWSSLDLTANDIDWDNLPSLGLAPDGSQEATFTKTLTPGATVWRGLWVAHKRIIGSDQRIHAVLASGILASSLTINSGDTVDISWNLKLTPTFV